MEKSCLACGGSGCRKNYVNPSGDYYYTHCVRCGGTGKETPAQTVAREADCAAKEEVRRQELLVRAAQKAARKARRRRFWEQFWLWFNVRKSMSRGQED